MILSGWGRYPRIDAKLNAPRSEEDLQALVLQGNSIARGNGRAYGDSAVSAQNTVHMRHFNRMLSFDAEQGQLVAEAGVMLADVIDAFLPRGWFSYVTPGTKFVTLGGMIAADVHGKNHHKDGSFGTYVDWIDVLISDGSVQRCSRSENTELFEWTVGGMGLTGIVLRAAIRLRHVSSAWIEQRTLVAENISHAIELFEQSHDATYSVAWIDCLQQGKSMGRSLVILGEHADAVVVPSQYRKTPLHISPKRKLSIPVEFPSWALNSLSVRAFNALYYWNGKRKRGQQLVDWDSYFYPLDAILGWNKIYGRHGFAQFQCVLPLQTADAGLRALLSAIANAGAGSFLAVLKRFGTQNSRFSFPMEGYTLALDFPVNKKTLALMERLDSITVEHGGRFYLAKDSRMSRDLFHQSEPRTKDFVSFRSDHAASGAFASAQSHRLGL
ncbi:FAD-binding oxidoreductase [Amylibacter sp.]|nr:FAD-binding oxidoreductase [Amylibacter sp.]MDB4178871.1 FAD-binding oxidoreductase [Amylibacter sp.]MDC1270062.1 FAD-binding oxidoreductase [Amylibacter sp.]MDC1414460.1 FAD-binding oxidoreductase [Amylibacter sp.]